MQDKGYAFVEFRSVEEASNAMALDGVKFRDAYLKVGGRAGGCFALSGALPGWVGGCGAVRCGNTMMV